MASFFWEQDGMLKDSSGETANEVISEYANAEVKPLFPYAVSSVEFGMSRCHFNEAFEHSNLDRVTKEKARSIYEQCVDMTSYTNWSGD